MRLNEFVNTGMVPSVARSSRARSTVKNPLHREVDVAPLSATCDLDAVGQGAQGTVGPAGTAVLRDVLVETVGKV